MAGRRGRSTLRLTRTPSLGRGPTQGPGNAITNDKLELSGQKGSAERIGNEVIPKKRNWDKVSSMSSGNANNEERREMIS